MTIIFSGEQKSVNMAPFNDIAGGDYVDFILERAPTKVMMRITNACYHFEKANDLVGVDEEMGAIRLVAAEEELVVAIFEWLKLNAEHMPEHKDFVGKFKNHVVKLSFYPVLQQFRVIIEGMFEGFSPEGLEGLVRWRFVPTIKDGEFYLSMQKEDGTEIWQHQPLHIDLRRGDIHGLDVVPLIV